MMTTRNVIALVQDLSKAIKFIGHRERFQANPGAIMQFLRFIEDSFRATTGSLYTP